MEPDAFAHYVQSYGKVKSGNKLDKDDFGTRTGIGYQDYDEKKKIAISLAAQDAVGGLPLRSKSEFEARLAELQK